MATLVAPRRSRRSLARSGLSLGSPVPHTGAVRRFVVHVLISTVAITLTLLVLSVVKVDGVALLEIPIKGSPSGGLNIDVGIGFLFALVAAVLPPIMAALFGRWYLSNPDIAYL